MMTKRNIAVLFLLPLGVAAILFFYRFQDAPLVQNSAVNEKEPALTTPAPAALIAEPLSDATSRVTKKPFGIKITPSSSPVQPEKFTGYHTGVDFETFESEAESDVRVNAICQGKLLAKKIVSGYGGVAVQKCALEGEDVTVLYGHLKFASIAPAVGDDLAAGQELGILGKGFSVETDGERKHLHLGFHKGSEINFRGYVASQSELDAWLDVMKYLPPAGAD